VPEPDGLDLIEYLKVLWKWKWLIMGGTVLAAIVSFVVASRTPLTYEASVTLLLAPSKLPGVPEAPSEPTVSPRTFADILKGKSLAGEVIQRFGLDKPPHNITVDSFVSRILSVRLPKETSFINLTVTLPDPRLAADAANFLAEKAVELLSRLGQTGALASRDFFRQQRDQAWQALEQARAALIDFKRAANLDRLETEPSAVLEEKARLKTMASEMSTKQAGLRIRNQKLSEALKQEEPTRTSSKSIITDPSLLAAAAERGVTDMKVLSSLQVKSQEINETYRDIRRELFNVEVSLASLESESKAVERKVEENRTRLAKIDQRIVSVKPKLEGLTEATSQARETYQFWSRKGDEAVVSVAARTPELKIVDPAIVPMAPISRKVGQKVAFAGAMAFIACSLLAFFSEYLLRVRQRRGEVR
jgi:uncharacterized protein involved in exopolysaccharide biosynthesis